jgi:2-oxo-3-(phosphooxy)propyl 3-oxoalkanoate synthase
MSTRVALAPTALRAAHDVRRYAGKADLDEVFIDSWRQLDGLTHSATAYWPCHHPFYAPASSYGLMLFTETVRQTLAVTSHLGLGIGDDYRMGWETLSCAVSPTGLAIGTAPAALRLTVAHETLVRRRSGLARPAARVQAWRDGVLLGTAQLNYTAYPPALYDRLRGTYSDARRSFAGALPPGPAVDPALVGRTDPYDVVLARDTSYRGDDSRRRWTLRADTTHSLLFDHPHDHIPGMVLLEAVSQAAMADAAPCRAVPVALDTTFSRYVEFDQPCDIVADESEAEGPGRRSQVVTGLQGGGTAFTTRVTSLIGEC